MGPKANSRRSQSQRRPLVEDTLPTSPIPAAATTVAEDSIQPSNKRQAEDSAEDSTSSDHSDFWQTAQSRRTARTARRAAKESRLASQLALQDPTQDVPMTSSSSASSSAPVESLPSTSSEVSSEDHLNEIQRQYVANAMLIARSLSPEQLQKRTRQLSDQLSAIDTTDQATDHSTSAEAAALRLANRIPKKNKKRARLTIVTSPPQDSDDPAAESSSQAPAISGTSLSNSAPADTDVSASSSDFPTVEPQKSNFNPYTSMTYPLLKGVITRAMVLKVTHLLETYNCPFKPIDCVPPETRSRFLSLLKRAYPMDEVKRNECNDWQLWSAERFCKELKAAVPNVTQAQARVSVIVSDSAVVPLKPTPEPDFKKFYVSRVSDQTTPRESNLIETLLDTGSLAGNFVLRQVVNDLNLQADIITKTCTSTVCSGLDNQCYDLTSTILLKLSYFCSIINNYASFEVQAFIVETVL